MTAGLVVITVERTELSSMVIAQRATSDVAPRTLSPRPERRCIPQAFASTASGEARFVRNRASRKERCAGSPVPHAQYTRFFGGNDCTSLVSVCIFTGR